MEAAAQMQDKGLPPWITLPSRSSEAQLSNRPRPPWRRILYQEQPDYPDSYLPADAWLTKQRKPVNGGVPPSHLSILIALSPLVQGLNVILIFLSVFQRLEQGRLYPIVLTGGCFAALLVASLVAWSKRRGESTDTIAHHSRRHPQARSTTPSLVISFAIVLLLLYALSPVLKTLTEATAEDTIYPLSFLLFALHIALADNTLPEATTVRRRKVTTSSRHADAQEQTSGNHRQKSSSKSSSSSTRLSSALSLNAATSASLVLASRLPSNEHVFALLFLAVLCFALLPRATAWLLADATAQTPRGQRPPPPPLPLIVGSIVTLPCIALSLALAGGGGGGEGASLLPTTLLVNGFVLVVVPAWMRRWYSRPMGPMTRLTGPWRVAKPDEEEAEEEEEESGVEQDSEGTLDGERGD